MLKDLESAIIRCQHKKVKRIVQSIVEAKDKSYVNHFFELLSGEIYDGLIICDLTRALFRLNRTSLADCSTIFLFDKFSNINIHESLLEVLGYDKMIPSIDDQRKIIERYFHFGDGMDLRYFSDPRYGLAAACAGWDENIVKLFLLHCLDIDDAPLKYVSKNSIGRRYVKLRSHS